MFGPGSDERCPVADVSTAGSECEPWSSGLLSGGCKIKQPDTQDKREKNRFSVQLTCKLVPSMCSYRFIDITLFVNYISKKALKLSL